MQSQKHVLPIIIIAQFFCTSLWFAGNAVSSELIADFGFPDYILAHLTSTVQLGFIIGTLAFAVLSITDKFSPSRVFFFSSFIGSIFNLAIIWEGNGLYSLLTFRFITGLCLAGVYPVGMKIAADYFDKGLGRSLGYLVGALVLGTALPHLLKVLSVGFDWQLVFQLTSGLAGIGGSLILFLVPDGPFRKRSGAQDFMACFKVFKLPKFRQAAIGYFGHMWELYAFWAFVPIILSTYQQLHKQEMFDSSLYSFLVIAIGSLACGLGGVLSERYGVKQTATVALTISTICCIISPFAIAYFSFIPFMLFLLIWGMAVIADSPLFSTLVAQNVDAEVKGAALTIVNSTGFAITIVSIQLLSYLSTVMPVANIYMVLAVGPLVGLIFLRNRL